MVRIFSKKKSIRKVKKQVHTINKYDMKNKIGGVVSQKMGTDLLDLDQEEDKILKDFHSMENRLKGLKNVHKIENFISKYFYHLTKSTDKVELSLEKSVVDFSDFDINSIYIVSFSKSLKNMCNVYLDEDLPDFIKNEYLLKLKDKVGALIVLYDTDSNVLKDLFINSFIRTYADMIFFDLIDKKIFDTFSYIGCKANIKIETDEYLLCLDRTVLWNEFKSY